MLWFYIHNKKTKFIAFIYIIYIIYNKYNIYTQYKCSVRKMEGSQTLSVIQQRLRNRNKCNKSLFPKVWIIRKVQHNELKWLQLWVIFNQPSMFICTFNICYQLGFSWKCVPWMISHCAGWQTLDLIYLDFTAAIHYTLCNEITVLPLNMSRKIIWGKNIYTFEK